MAEEIKFPQEGMLTLVAEFTKSRLQKVVDVVKHLHEKGWSEDRIQKKMQAELLTLDEHTRRLVYDKAVGRTSPDDIAPENVASEKELKPGTIELTVHTPPAAVQQMGLLRYRGEEWYVAVKADKKIRLKRLL